MKWLIIFWRLKSQLTLYQGNFSIYEEQKLRDAFELAENEKSKEVNRLKETARKKRNGR